MQYQDISDGDGVPWRDITGSHRTFASKLEEGGSDSSIDTTVMTQSAAGANESQYGKLSMDREGKLTCRTDIPLLGNGAVVSATSNSTKDTAFSVYQLGLDERARECYKCVHIDVENADGSPGEFLAFPPYSAPGGLQEVLFPYRKSSTSASITSPTSAKQENAVMKSSFESYEMVQLDESSSSLNDALETSTDYLIKTFRRLGLVAGASLLRFGDLSVYEEAHFSAGGELNDCADLTHLGGCGCFEEQRRLYQLRLEAFETTNAQCSKSSSTTNADRAQISTTKR